VARERSVRGMIKKAEEGTGVMSAAQ